MNVKAGLTRKKKYLLAAIVLAAAAAALGLTRLPASEAVTCTQAEAEAVTMKQTLTAAGELKAASSEEVAFSTSRYFAGMCVEEGDAVRKGQHLISYSDGTYTDAPDDGVVAAISAPETGTIAGEDHTVSLAYTNQMVLEITVPEDEISKVSKGDRAVVSVGADSAKSYKGTITAVKAISTKLLTAAQTEAEDADSETDGASGSSSASSAGSAADRTAGSSGQEGASSGASTAYYSVTLAMTNDGTLKPGMSGSCTITVSSRRSVLAVPIEAVYFDEDDAAYVNAVDGTEVTRTPVTTGESDANYVEIKEGLAAGDTVQIEQRR